MKALLLTVIALFALLGCGATPDCPTKSGYNSCGYCSQDAATSGNPHAGMCTYCTTSCGSDPCSLTCGGGGAGGSCDASWVSRCGQTVNGIQFAGQPWSKSCGDCPRGTRKAGEDNVSPGAPYWICTCNGV